MLLSDAHVFFLSVLPEIPGPTLGLDGGIAIRGLFSLTETVPKTNRVLKRPRP
jgi:hypothetical protein